MASGGRFQLLMFYDSLQTCDTFCGSTKICDTFCSLQRKLVQGEHFGLTTWVGVTTELGICSHVSESLVQLPFSSFLAQLISGGRKHLK